MSKKKKVKRKRNQQTAGPAKETQVAEAVTAVWMLSTLTALLCQLGSAAALLYASISDAPQGREGGELFGRLLLFAALIIGVVGLALLPFVLRWRRTRPPWTITLLAAIICGIPPVFLAAALVYK